MISYVYRPGHDYREFLQNKEYLGGIDASLYRETARIVGQIDRSDTLQRKIFADLEIGFRDAANSLDRGFDRLGDQLEALQATFEWGFSEMIAAAGITNGLLHDLLRAAQTPSQTWAYEQFQIALDAFSRALYKESLAYTDRAIGGDASQGGYGLEHRFHYLRGKILLGDYKNYDRSIVDSHLAESAFVNAARYSRHDEQVERHTALLSASWAAYISGSCDDAIRYIRKILE
jgi:hypothetical protein